MWFKLNLDVTDAFGNHPLRTFRPEYGYDIAEAIGKYPIKGLDKADKLQEAITALKNGNYLHAEIMIGKKTVPVSIVANPQMKTIDIYDKNRVELRDETIFAGKVVKEKLNATQEMDSPNSQKLQKQQKTQPWEQDANQQQTQRRSR